VIVTQVVLLILGLICVMVGLVALWNEGWARSVGLPGTRSQRVRFGIIALLAGLVLVNASRTA